MDRLADLARTIEEAQPPGQCKLRIAKITAVGGDGRLQTDLTGTAWLRRNTDITTFATNQRVLVIQQGGTAVVVCPVG